MHELSIAMSLVELAEQKRSELGDVTVEALHVRIGALSGVVTAALASAFELAAAGSSLAGARLEIEEVPLVVFCKGCQQQRQLAGVQRFRCPVCDAPTPDLVRGKELELHALEVSEDAPPHR